MSIAPQGAVNMSRHAKAEVSAEGMDDHASTDVGNLEPFDQNGLVHAEHDHLQNRHHEQLCGH